MAWYLIEKPWPGQTWILRSNISKILSKADWDEKKQQQYKNNKNTISQHWSWGRYTNISISTLSCVVTWLWKDNEFDGVFYIQPQQKKPILCLQKPNPKCDVAQRASFNIFCVSITVISYFYYNILVCFRKYGYIHLCSN